jgi:hypothetical protein
MIYLTKTSNTTDRINIVDIPLVEGAQFYTFKLKSKATDDTIVFSTENQSQSPLYATFYIGSTIVEERISVTGSILLDLELGEYQLDVWESESITLDISEEHVWKGLVKVIGSQSTPQLFNGSGDIKYFEN